MLYECSILYRSDIMRNMPAHAHEHSHTQTHTYAHTEKTRLKNLLLRSNRNLIFSKILDNISVHSFENYKVQNICLQFEIFSSYANCVLY